MARILFRMLSQSGHHHGTFALADELKHKGHTIIYAAPIKFKTLIEINGFEFFGILPSEEITRFEKPRALNALKATIHRIKRLISLGFKSRRIIEKAASKKHFQRIIKEVLPDLILLDSSLKMWALEIYKENVSFITIQTFPYAFRHTPPRDSYLLPGNTVISKIALWLSWRKYYLRRIGYLSPKKLTLALAVSNQFPIDKLDFKQQRPMGFINVPEINTIPPAFDFPIQLPPFKYYFCQSKMFSRKEFLYDYSFNEQFEELKAIKKKIVFCALGTLGWRYPKTRFLMKTLVEIFENLLSDYALILCVDDDLQRQHFRSLQLTNVYIYKYVPQQKVLSELADVMISHGGMNSIIECIFTYTPIFIFPGSSRFDQIGNASRVNMLGIGRIGKYYFSQQEIKQTILSLLNDDFYQENLNRLNGLIIEDSKKNDAIDLINSVLS